jgi:hypothetical protein
VRQGAPLPAQTHRTPRWRRRGAVSTNIGDSTSPLNDVRSILARALELERTLADGRTDCQFPASRVAVDLRRAPQMIRLRHRADQGSNVGRDGWSTRAMAAPPGPEEAEASPMPGENRLGFTITTAERHSRQIRDNPSHKRRSAQVRGTRRGRDRSRTWSWCRNARISSCRAARVRIERRRILKRERRTGIGEEPIRGRRQHQSLPPIPIFMKHSSSETAHSGCH